MKNKKVKNENKIENGLLIRNEIDANKQMINVSVITAIFLVVLLIFYAVGYFTGFMVLADQAYLLILIFFPLNILLLASNVLWVKNEKILSKPGFKYFLLFLISTTILLLTITIPKHTIIAWALPILLSAHYYNPKVGRRVFIGAVVGMIISLYAGMFIGEYDNNLLGPGVAKMLEDGTMTIEQPAGPVERWEMLMDAIKAGQQNRILTAFLYYGLPRSLTLAIIFMSIESLNRRTGKLFANEIVLQADKTQLESEMSVAHNIQQNALPAEMVMSDKVNILAELVPTKDVGGDLYDYFKLDDTHIAFLVGDVSGKGVPAAMFMMKTITCFEAYASAGKKPSEVLQQVNKVLNKGNDSQMFVTCFFAILDTETGVLTYANAGHNPPLISSKEGGFRYLKCNPGFILGPMEETFVKDEEIKMEKGDCFILYTDGITEAKNLESKLYGEERLLSFCNSKKFETLIELHYELRENIKAFVNGAPQSDDMTYLLFRYQEEGISIEEKIFDATPESTKEMLNWLSDNLEKRNLISLEGPLAVVMDEIYSNIVKFAYPDKLGQVYLRMIFDSNKKKISLTVVDEGIEFNPLETHEEKLSSADVDDRALGGLGILIVKQTMDSISYNRINGKNILAMSKTFK